MASGELPNKFLIVAFALAMGGVIIGIFMPILLIQLGITSVEIAPGLDLLTVALPVVGIIDWIMAYYFWRLGRPPAARDRNIVG